MEDTASLWQIGIIALLAGAMIGVLVYRLLSPSVKQADQIKSERDAATKELDSYKASVNQHFDKTSELVNDLTQNYVKVYQHLAEGAQTLGDSKSFNNLLEQRPGRVSIALDDDANSAAKSVDDRIVDAAVAPAEPVVGNVGDDIGDLAVTSAEAVDEHAEPFTDRPVAETEPLVAKDDGAENDVVKTPDESDSPGEAAEPVINVDALAEAETNADGKILADVPEVPGEDEKKTETSVTTH